MTRYTTDNGTVITDAMVERWAEDAEQGFAHSTVTPVTRTALGNMHRADETPYCPGC